MSKPITYACGCINEIDSRWDIMRSVSKCSRHRRMSGKSGLAHYADMGAIKNRTPQCRRYIAQLVEALPDSIQSLCGTSHFGQKAIEIGCGASMYVPLLLKAGYDYLGVDTDAEAADWTQMAFDVAVCTQPFEQIDFPPQSFDLVLAAHCLEHIPDAPAAVGRMFEILKPDGSLLLLIPDDSDPLNPDHLWFFSTDTISKLLQVAGFELVAVAVRRYIPRENFIYIHAKRPALVSPPVVG